MQRYLFSFVLIFALPLAAQDNLEQAKIELLKSFYEQYLLNEEQLAQAGDKYEAANFFSTEYISMINIDALEDDEVLECLDYDPYIQGQDVDVQELQKTITYQADKDMIKVAFKQFDNDLFVHYKFSCSENKCLISDLIIPAFEDEENKIPEHSYPQSIKQCVEEVVKNRESNKK